MFKGLILILMLLLAIKYTINRLGSPNKFANRGNLNLALTNDIEPIMSRFSYDWSKFGLTSSYLSLVVALLPYYIIHMILRSDSPFFYTISSLVLIMILVEGYKLYQRVNMYALANNKSEFIDLVLLLENRFDMKSAKYIEGTLSALLILIVIINIIFFKI